MEKTIPIELLAPARNAEFGIHAVNHGADAVYIGASNFGARVAASNPISDIERLVKHAHLYRAKVYATLNTILYDRELAEAEKLIHELYSMGIDGIIIQDMGILELNLPPIPLIASTQTNNTTTEKVLFLEKTGFKRVILARELSLEEIKKIRSSTNVELESFVHGALCVSYSGQCYMSQAICGRSGNRGVCAQPCRSAYDLTDKKGNILIKNKHLLSLKDLNLSEHIAELLEAGITSFKIEGRLKDISYVKNIVAFYRQEIDKILNHKQGFRKSSSGKTNFPFTPDPEKSFNRGFTQYYIYGRKEKNGSFLTQKSLGKRIGKITELSGNWFKADGEELYPQDGICFFDDNQQLSGTLINKAFDLKYYPKDMFGLKAGLEIFRNQDQRFEKLLEKSSNARKIEIKLCLKEWEHGILLEAEDEDLIHAKVEIKTVKAPAEKPEFVKGQMINQLKKLGNTPFTVSAIEIKTDSVYFISTSILNQLRRDLVDKLMLERIKTYRHEEHPFQPNNYPYPEKHLTYKGNVLNHLAQKFYERHGVERIEPAFETLKSFEDKIVMTSKHCIRFQLDACPIHQKSLVRFNEPLFLKDNTHTYKLEFDCNHCEMKVIYVA